MAESVSVEREIGAPPERVWEMVADVTRMGDWSPETVACEWLDGATGATVGARFRGRNRRGLSRWSTVCTVVAADPGAAFAFESAVGPVRIARWEYRFEPTSTGCRVTETWHDQRNPVLIPLGNLVSGVASRATHNRAGMEATLERLAEAAQSTTA